ncbi:(2Fe-2S)-binding protein [bacterium]|nr:(2Fe-2S)-binding protein [candidate division CSSED10-310 bacterium]
MKSVRFRVNGHPVTVDVPPAMSLQTVLRDVLNLTGTKDGCRGGECGACTVLVDGEPVNSCLIPVCQIQDREVITIEAFERPGEPHPLIRAFAEQNAVQCGFCTPGMILSAAGLLAENPRPDRETIRTVLAGNICRCTGYENIFRATDIRY